MKFVVACIAGLLLRGVAGAEPVIEGQVRLSGGLAVEGVHVVLFDLSDLRRGVVAQATTDADGQFALPLAATGLPAGFGLGQNYPNPFNPGTVIPYELATTAQVRLEVFNLLGQRLATLVDGVRAAGVHTARWDARDASGHGVAAGVYVYRLTAGGATQTRRMVLVDGSAGEAVSAAVPTRTAVAPTTETAYGLVVSGAGVVAYVDADFRVGAGSVEVVVESVGLAGSGKRMQLERGILGDVDNSGRVDLLDALMVAMYVANPATVLPNGGTIALGDVNGDGAIDITDAWLIGLYSSKPWDARLPPGIGESVEISDEGDVLAPVESGDEGVVLAAVESGGKWGFIDPQGTYAINPQFDDAYPFSDGLARVRIGDWDTGKWGFIDPQGTYAINPQFDDAYPFSDGLARVQTDGKWGFIDPQGAYAINPQFDEAYSFWDGLARVQTDGKWGFINPQGAYAINPQFDEARSFWDGLAPVETGGKWGFIDRQGTYAINPQFDEARSFWDGLAPVETGGKWGFIDRQGTYVINPQFDEAYSFWDGLAHVQTDGKWGFINLQGAYAINPQFDYAYPFWEGLAPVETGGKWGFIDRQGTYAINPQFDWAGLFSEGLAAVQIGGESGKYGFIDRQGTYAINPQFDWVQSFSEGLAAVRIGDWGTGKWGFIDPKGTYAIKPQFDDVGDFHKVER